MPEQRRPSGGHADQERAEPAAIARSASAWEKVKTAAIIGASAGGAILAVAAGAPAWFGAVYAALGLFAAAYRIRRYRGRPVPRRRPSAGPRPELAAHLALAAPPGSDRPSPRRRGTPDESSAPRRAAPGSGEPSPARHAVPAAPPPSPARRAAPASASGQPSPARRAAPAPRPLSTAARADAAAAT